MHQNGEISVRDRSAPYKGGMFAAYPGDVVFSKMGARDGAIGVLQQDIPRAVVTSEFPVFAPESDRLDGAFARLALRTGGVLAALGARASGSGRKRVSPEAFADLRVPLPPLPRQRAIAAMHRAAVSRAADMEREADEIEARAMAEFEAALGFAPPAPLPDRPVFVASFKDLDRWSHEGILRRAVEGTGTVTSPYPTVRLRDVIRNLVVGWSPKCLNRLAEKNEWGILKLSAITSGRFDPKQTKALPEKIRPRASLTVKPGDVLIARGSGVTRLVGAATFVSKVPSPKIMICDLIFRVTFPEKNKIDPQFLVAILTTTNLRNQIEDKRTGAAPMMQKITKSALMSLQLPLPSMKDQIAMRSGLDGAHVTANELRHRAQKARIAARANFEAAVYTTEENSENSAS